MAKRTPTPAASGGGRAAALYERWRGKRGIPEAIRITRVGLWFVLFTIVVGVAATNTGNNALYLVLSAMLALLAVSGLVSRHNLEGLAIEVEAPGEIHARRPVVVEFRVTNRARLLPRWLLLLSLAREGPWRLVPYLAAGRSARGSIEMLFPRRGRQRIDAAHFASLFPLGLFRKGMRYRVGLELLVYPELFPPGEARGAASGLSGDRSAPRPGWGHELHALRGFREGDDPRAIHWKKSAQTGGLVFQEREAEETMRCSILFDNAAARFEERAARRLSSADAERFERLVSEAATAAWDHLERGFEVELVTRGRRLPYGQGARQRREILTELALVEPVEARSAALLPGDAGALLLRFGLGDADGAAGAAA
jgi:uncharacterized protein (DUF58 family)